jgi:hypothetical protein
MIIEFVILLSYELFIEEVEYESPIVRIFKYKYLWCFICITSAGNNSQKDYQLI